MAKKAKTTAPATELPLEFNTAIFTLERAPKGCLLTTPFPDWANTGMLRTRSACLLQPIYVEREAPFEFTNPRKYPTKHADDTYCWLQDGEGGLSTPFIQAGTVLRLTDRPNGKTDEATIRRIFYIFAEAVVKEDFKSVAQREYVVLGPFSSYTATWAALEAVASESPGGPLEERIMAAKPKPLALPPGRKAKAQ